MMLFLLRLVSQGRPTINFRNAHKRLFSDQNSSFNNKISFVDAKMLREKGREIKLKNKRFHYVANMIREGARSQASTNSNANCAHTESLSKHVQTNLSLPIRFEHELYQNDVNSSERTMRKSTRIMQNEYNNDKAVKIFMKVLEDLSNSEIFPKEILVYIQEGFHSCLGHILDQANKKIVDCETELERVICENNSLANQNKELLIKNSKLKGIVAELKLSNKDLFEQIEFLKQREIERIQQLDLDDIDLVTPDSSVGLHKLNLK
jgi:hypothetical protein